MKKRPIERHGLLSESEARPILEPHVTGLIDDFHESFGWVQEILDQETERRATFDTSTQAAMVFDRFVIVAGRRFARKSDAILKRYGRMLRVLLGDRRAALRFKKLKMARSGHLVSGNVKTNAQALIYHQLGFDTMADARPTELTFGYTTDVSNTEVTGLYITCPISFYKNKFVIALEGGEKATLPFADPGNPDQSPTQTTIIITTKIKKKKAENG